MEQLKDWFLSLGDRYHVNPFIFGIIYVGAIPLFWASLWWLIRNVRKGRPVFLPVLFAGLCFISAYLYLIIAGRDIPFWVYIFIALLVGYSAFSTIRKVKKKTGKKDKKIAKL